MASDKGHVIGHFCGVVGHNRQLVKRINVILVIFQRSHPMHQTMPYKSFIFWITLLSIQSLWANQAKANPDLDKAQLKHLKLTLWPQAYRTQDAKLLGQILHPQFQMIDANGQTSTRQEELQYVANNPWTAVNFQYHIERLEVFDGRTAMVSGRGETDAYQYHSSNVLIKQDGRWQAIASHVSGFQHKAAKDQN